MPYLHTRTAQVAIAPALAPETESSLEMKAARVALAPVLVPEPEQSLPKSVIRRRKIARGAILGFAMSIAAIAVFGAAALAFFTTQQFGMGIGMAEVGTNILGFFVGGIIFLAYYGTWGKSTWREVKQGICEKFFPLKAKKKVDDELDPDDENNNKLTKKQKAAMSVSLVIGIVSMAAIGAGSYLGVMAVGTTLALTTVFFPIAMVSTVCMFIAASAFCLPDMLQQTAKLFAPKSEKQKNEQVLTKKQKVKGRLVMVGAWVFAGGATFGFPAFKFFCTTSFFAGFGLTSIGVSIATGGGAFVAMFIMTGFTSGMRILDRGRAFRRKVEGRTNGDVKTKTVIPNKPRYAFGLGVGVCAALFNGVGAYMGVMAIGAVMASAIPVLNLVATPLFMGLVMGFGIAIGIWRTVDFWFYSVPGIKEAVGGAKKVEVAVEPVKEEVSVPPVESVAPSSRATNAVTHQFSVSEVRQALDQARPKIIQQDRSDALKRVYPSPIGIKPHLPQTPVRPSRTPLDHFRPKITQQDLSDALQKAYSQKPVRPCRSSLIDESADWQHSNWPNLNQLVALRT